MARVPRRRVREFYNEYLPIGDRLGEMFYAIWMVVVSLGFLNSGENPEELLFITIAIAFTVNIVWGLIDGTSVMYTNIIDFAKTEQIIYDLRTKNDQPTRQAAQNAMDDSIVSVLSKEEKDRIIDAIANGAPGENPYKKKYYAQRPDRYYALGILAIDASLVIPLIAPLLIIPDVHQAIYFSRLIATIMFAVIGAAYAKNLNRRRWLAALFLATLGFSIFSLAFLAGW